MTPRTEEVAPDVYAYVQPDGGWCVNNAGFVVGDDTVLVVDTAATEDRARALLAEVERRAPGRRQLILSTHHHGDHTFGNWVFRGATVIAHESGPPELDRRGLSMQGLWPGVRWGHVEIVPPTVRMRDFLALRVGGIRVELIHVGPAHTPDDVVAWLPDHRVVFAGDVVFSGAMPFVLMGSLSGSLRAIARLRALDPLTVVAGHGDVCGPEILDTTAATLRWTGEIARAGLAAGSTPLDAARRAGPQPGLRHPERLVANLHRAYFEERGGAEGAYLSSSAAVPDMVTLNRGEPLPCNA